MKKILILVLVVAACSSKKDFRVNEHLTAAEQADVMDKIIRYAGRAPEGLLFEERFYPAYDSFYLEQARLHRFDAYYREGDRHYFLISRSAPSLVDKRVATGGTFVFEGENITAYEEIFRTWKMVPDTLARRSLFLFEKMVNGESLTPYETRNAKGVEYIEFPDERTYFDKAGKQWKVKSD